MCLCDKAEKAVKFCIFSIHMCNCKTHHDAGNLSVCCLWGIVEEKVNKIVQLKLYAAVMVFQKCFLKSPKWTFAHHSPNGGCIFI